MDFFSRYSPFIQDYIYRQGWQTLRAVQAAAADAIFNTHDNLLLCASTASGKTEAAFFPIITLMQEQPPASIGCLYIAPLKALISIQALAYGIGTAMYRSLRSAGWPKSPQAYCRLPLNRLRPCCSTGTQQSPSYSAISALW